jgi:hypothetical protein
MIYSRQKYFHPNDLKHLKETAEDWIVKQIVHELIEGMPVDVLRQRFNIEFKNVEDVYSSYPSVLNILKGGVVVEAYVYWS